jgi:hypothetical protein
METRNHTFATYRHIEQADAAVDRLLSAGFPASQITVLLLDHAASIEFARRKGTAMPHGIENDPDKPLEGSLGILYPGEGPKRGVLDDALDGMGVPLDWPHGVTEGNTLVSVESDNVDEARAALGESGPVQVGSATLNPTTAYPEFPVKKP